MISYPIIQNQQQQQQNRVTNIWASLNVTWQTMGQAFMPTVWLATRKKYIYILQKVIKYSFFGLL